MPLTTHDLFTWLAEEEAAVNPATDLIAQVLEFGRARGWPTSEHWTPAQVEMAHRYAEVWLMDRRAIQSFEGSGRLRMGPGIHAVGPWDSEPRRMF